MNPPPSRQKRRLAPPLTPVLLAGIATRPLPPQLLQPALTAIMAVIKRKHPGMFERLAGLKDPLYLVDPVDLPFVFLLSPDAEAPRVEAVRETQVPEEITATIRGPLLTLLDLLEGRIDGDAMFFSRELVIEGDTEAVVALRNAVDGEDMDLVGDVLSVLGPLGGPARTALDLAGGIFTRATQDLETLRAAVIAPAMRRAEAQAAELRNLEKKMASSTGRSGRAARTRRAT